jgi:hypothetical protein
MRMMRMSVLGAAAAVAVAATALSAAQVATADDFDVTAGGVASGETLTDLPPTSTVTMAVSNLPAGVGLYAFHCLVPPPGAMPIPTRCDDGEGTLMYIVAAGAPQTTTRPLVVNAEFLGKNPNPQTGDTGTTQVNCRVDACAIYTLGAGRDSANPAYIRTFATTFAKVGPRMKDRAVVSLNGKKVKPGRERTVFNSKATPFVVTLKSGLTPSLSSKKCDVRGGEIRALTTRGACNVRITAPGNEEYRPFRGTVTFKIKK